VLHTHKDKIITVKTDPLTTNGKMKY